MRNVFIIFVLSFNTSLFGQNLGHYIIPTQEPNFNFDKFYVINEEIVIPYIYLNSDFKSNSVILKTDLNQSAEYYFTNTDMSISPLLEIDEEYYLIGENPNSFEDSIVVTKLNESLDDYYWFRQFEVDGYGTLNTGSVSIDSNIYLANTNRPSSTSGDRYLQFIKIDKTGDLVWSNLFNEQHQFSSSWSLLKSLDGNLLGSIYLNYFNTFGAFAQIVKIDLNGNIIWDTQGTEKLHDGGAVYLTELSDSNLVQTYRISGNQAPDIQFKWYDKNGDYLFNKRVISTDKNEIIISNIESGRGNYFFAYGEYTLDHPEQGGDNDYFGMITKFDNQGDTIWSHWYQHPDFQNTRVLHNINDIIELENGDIWAVGTIQDFLVDPERKIWLFKINEHGCLKDGLTNCDQIVTSTKDIGAAPLTDRWKVSPNPSTGRYHISSDEIHRLEKIEIYNQHGERIKSINHSTNYIDLTNFSDGVYNVRMYLDNGMYVMKRVVKL